MTQDMKVENDDDKTKKDGNEEEEKKRRKTRREKKRRRKGYSDNYQDMLLSQVRLAIGQRWQGIALCNSTIERGKRRRRARSTTKG